MAFTLREIADMVGGEVIGDDQSMITGISSLHEGTKGDLSFFSDHRYRNAVKRTKASALLVSKAIEFFEGSQVVVPNPALA